MPLQRSYCKASLCKGLHEAPMSFAHRAGFTKPLYSFIRLQERGIAKLQYRGGFIKPQGLCTYRECSAKPFHVDKGGFMKPLWRLCEASRGFAKILYKGDFTKAYGGFMKPLGSSYWALQSPWRPCKCVTYLISKLL